MNISDKPIDELLGIPKVVEAEPVPVEEEKVFLPGITNAPQPPAAQDSAELEKLKKDEEQFTKDFEEARRNMLFVIEGAKDSLEKITKIAEDKETAKEFDALNNLLRTIADSSSVLMNLHERKKKYREKVHGIKATDSSTNINNAVFVGNSSEFKEILSKMRKSIDS